MAANKVKGIRCALCWNEETARLSRHHNDANALSFGQRVIRLEMALKIVRIWLRPISKAAATRGGSSSSSLG